MVGHSGVGLYGLLDPLQVCNHLSVDGRHVGGATWDVAPGCDSLKHAIADQRAPRVALQHKGERETEVTEALDSASGARAVRPGLTNHRQ